uniref:Zinc finger C2H2-type domain-containing protein n=1 Tax=uncultured marine thaumarchaeote AD1000_72_F04 TaxID=1455938 RepID=A0A075FY35_9ARCH|nr:zinc finger C2H2-type domain-containing protein [uncultured marine thaumarchaeote AD1000_72_F04]
MITVDCHDVESIQNELVVYVADQIGAVPNLKYHEFILSPIEDDGVIDQNEVVTSIREFLSSIGEQTNFAVISKGDTVSIESIRGKTIERDQKSSSGLFSCPHCGHVTQYEVVHNTHMKIHYF